MKTFTVERIIGTADGRIILDGPEGSIDIAIDVFGQMSGATRYSVGYDPSGDTDSVVKEIRQIEKALISA